ncbi:MAG: response regulator [Desulfobacterales bacterium]
MKKILIADDMAEIRELVSLTLQRGDYVIYEAQNGKEAVDLSRTHQPDLIIMDILMPGEIDGLEATRHLKSFPETKEIPIILLTGKGKEVDKEEGLAAGALDYFAKPFSPLALIRKVEEIIE